MLRSNVHPTINGDSANSGLWRSVTQRGSCPTGSVTGCAACHETRHSPRLRLAPPCSHPRPRPGVAELGVVRRLRTIPVRTKLFAKSSISRVTVVGFISGLVISVAYIVFTRDPFPLFPPTWAAIIYYPGLVAGWCSAMFFERTLHLSLSAYIYTAIGCIAEGLACAAISIFAAFGVAFFRRLPSRTSPI